MDQEIAGHDELDQRQVTGNFTPDSLGGTDPQTMPVAGVARGPEKGVTPDARADESAMSSGDRHMDFG